MRDVVVPRLGSGAVVVLAGRSRPERAWLADGWEHVARDLELGPLRHADVSTLLAHHGVVDPDRVADITTWSRGLPLAVTVAARVCTGRACHMAGPRGSTTAPSPWDLRGRGPAVQARE